MSVRKQNPVFTSGASVLLAALTVMLMLTGCKKEDEPTAPQVQNGWVSQQSGTNERLFCAHFADANTGTVIGDDGTILCTTDGGATWTPRVCPYAEYGVMLTGVAFADGNNATITGEVTLLMLRTTDGGVSWFPQNTGLDFTHSPQLRDVTYPDANIGIAVVFDPWTAPMILRTTNGGADWRKHYLPVEPWKGFYAVSFPTTDIGYIVGSEGFILRTDNGGVTWSTQNSGVTEEIHHVSFADANTGIAIGYGSEAVGDTAEHRYRKWSIILRTTDGGSVWTKLLTIPDMALSAVCVTDADNATIVGERGTILRTTDGGTTWVNQISGTMENLHDVYFSDSNTGTAIGDNGVILRTTNGGFSK
ncbi:MAG: YCF48-related protein [Bacteroidota bacterium]